MNLFSKRSGTGAAPCKEDPYLELSALPATEIRARLLAIRERVCGAEESLDPFRWKHIRAAAGMLFRGNDLETLVVGNRILDQRAKSVSRNLLK